MTAMHIGLVTLVAAATAYTLEPFTVAHDTLERTNVSKAKARGGTYDRAATVHWVPQALDDTAEAYHASQTFANDRKASLEFVHVHKCGGMTFNHVVNENKNGSCVAPSSDEDAKLYASMHAADAQVYEVVKRIFEQRWRRAEREGWGATPETCGCAFVAGPCVKDAYDRCIPSDCESYHDGCNTCSIQDGRLDACTEMFCETPKEPRCLDAVVGGPTGDEDQDACCGGGSACGYVYVDGKCVHVTDACLKDAYDRCVPEDCASYFDGCNTCSVGENGLGCTLMYCETPGQPKCLDEKPGIPLWVVGAVLLGAPLWCVCAVPVLACLGNCLFGESWRFSARRRRVPAG